MYNKIKETAKKLFDSNIDFRIRLFNVLALAGTGISATTFILNCFTAMWTSTILSAFLAILSSGLLIYTHKTGKYQVGYIITIVTIFMILFPMLFFVSGGYKSGMPSMFNLPYCLQFSCLKAKKRFLYRLLKLSNTSWFV